MLQLLQKFAASTADTTYTYTTTTSDPQQVQAAAGVILIVWLGFMLVSLISIISLWKIFNKAGKPGWASIIPIYNTIVLLEIIGRPAYQLIFLFIPFANIYFSIIFMVELAHKFDRSTGFAVGLILVPAVFLPILAFGDAQYQKAQPDQYNPNGPVPPQQPLSPVPLYVAPVQTQESTVPSFQQFPAQQPPVQQPVVQQQQDQQQPQLHQQQPVQDQQQQQPPVQPPQQNPMG